MGREYGTDSLGKGMVHIPKEMEETVRDFITLRTACNLKLKNY